MQIQHQTGNGSDFSDAETDSLSLSLDNQDYCSDLTDEDLYQESDPVSRTFSTSNFVYSKLEHLSQLNPTGAFMPD